MANIKAWVSAARPRTLPLSVAGIIVGAGLAAHQGEFRLPIFLLAILTTIAFQVLSNFANDYGDGVKGTDNEERVGPQRALQSGAITPRTMKSGIVITVVLSLLLALALIYTAFGRENLLTGFVFLLLALASIAAAIKYTVGKTAYGYQGLGDVFVFLFFGVVSVCGSYYLYTKHISVETLLPAATVGLFSAAVLNLNNMRDIVNDQKVGKRTLAVLLGFSKAKKYHIALLLIGMATTLVFCLRTGFRAYDFLFVIAYLPLFVHLKKLNNTEKPEHLDPELKKVALSTFLFSVLFAIGYNIFL